MRLYWDFVCDLDRKEIRKIEKHSGKLFFSLAQTEAHPWNNSNNRMNVSMFTISYKQIFPAVLSSPSL